jgi:non-homologous end joining protein Ku
MRHKKVAITIEGAPLATVPAGIAYAIDKPKDVSLSYVFEDGRRPITQYVNPATGEVAMKRPNFKGTPIGAKKDEHGEILTLVPTAEWDAINEQAKLNIVGFVERAAVAERVDRVCDVHYLQIQEGYDASALAMIANALTDSDKVAVCDFVVGGRERLGILMPRADGVLVIVSLIYAEHLREPDSAVSAVALAEVRDELVESVEALIEEHTLDSVKALDERRDDNLARRRELLARVVAGEVVAEAGEAEPVEDTSLAVALAASLAAATAKPKGKGKGGKRKAKAAA